MIIIKSPSPVIFHLFEIATSSHVLALPKTTSIFSRILAILSLSYFMSIGLCSASMIQSWKIGVLNRQEDGVKVINGVDRQ